MNLSCRSGYYSDFSPYLCVRNTFRLLNPEKMKSFRFFLLILIIPFFLFASCSSADDPEPVESHNEKTLFIYMPWSSNLTSYFYQNIRDMESAIENMGGLIGERVIVFISTSATDASMFEIVCENGSPCRTIDLKDYSLPAFTTEDGLAGILRDVFSFAPAESYSMIIGCHGMGWLPVNGSRASRSDEISHFDYTGPLLTRYFGGTTREFQTDITTLSAAIADTGLKMEYILFDDCYMSSIEVAYELKDVADYLIASTCEVMAYGMPYATMGSHLLGTPDYKAVCDDFYEFYSNYTAMPCGTLSVTDLSQIDGMAEIMKRINATCEFDSREIAALQNLDGYSPTIFYDYGDYVRQLLAQNDVPQSMIDEFEMHLSLLIPFKTNTERFFTASRGPLKINTYSGITTSDPSLSPRALEKTSTKWYRATH